MNRIRLAAWAAVAGLGLLSGCSSFGNNSGDCGRQGLFSRLTSRMGHGRSTIDCCGPECGPIGPSCPSCPGGTCGEGPMLGDPGGGGPVPPLAPAPFTGQPLNVQPPPAGNLAPLPRPYEAQPTPAPASPTSRHK